MKKLDPFGWFVCTLHDTLGHDKARAYLRQPEYGKERCIMCRYNRGEVTKEQVIEQMGVEV